MLKWTPQNDILADKRLHAFITHGGMASTQETAVRGKPGQIWILQFYLSKEVWLRELVTFTGLFIPFLADQPRNSGMMEENGLGKVSFTSRMFAYDFRKSQKVWVDDPIDSKKKQMSREYSNLSGLPQARSLRWWKVLRSCEGFDREREVNLKFQTTKRKLIAVITRTWPKSPQWSLISRFPRGINSSSKYIIIFLSLFPLSIALKVICFFSTLSHICCAWIVPFFFSRTVEFAAQFGPSAALRPQSFDMSWIEYHNVDIIAVLAVFSVIGAFVALKIASFVVTQLSSVVKFKLEW